MFKHLFGKSVPVLQQSEVAECGAICVAMIASYHGFSLSTVQMREQCQRLNLSRQGNNLAEIIKLAHSLHLNATALQADVEELVDCSLPCILHWDLNHYVVLTSINKDTFIINDPAIGKVTLNKSEFSKHFTGVVLVLNPNLDFIKQPVRKDLSIGHIWKQCNNLNRHLAILLALSLFLQCLQILTPYYLQLTVDRVLIDEAEALMVTLAIFFVALLLLRVTFSVLRSWILVRLNTELSFGFGVSVMQHLLHLPASYFQTRHLGDIQSRFSSVYFLQERLTHGIVESLLDGVMIVILLLVMSIYSWVLTLCVLFSLMIYWVIRTFLYPVLQQHSQTLLQLQAKETSTFLDCLKQWRIQLLHNRQSERAHYWAQCYTRSLRQDVRLQVWKLSFDGIQTLLFGLSHIAIIFVATQLIMQQQMSIGMLLAFIAYQQFAMDSGARLIEQWLQFRLLGMHMERLSDITHTSIEENRNGQTRLSECISSYDHAATLTVDNVSFSYPGASNNLLNNIFLHVKKGESVVLTGPSGIGKSTLLHLMLGLYQPTQGQILFNGVDIRALGLVNYRSQIGAVLQNDELARGSLLDNITLFDPTPDEALVYELLALTGLTAIIQSLPMGLITQCGELGEILSSGQMQRLMLVRALYRRPKILFMDEATSHLDAETEAVISEAIAKLKMTRIIIAHRQETIATAQRTCSLLDV